MRLVLLTARAVWHIAMTRGRVVPYCERCNSRIEIRPGGEVIVHDDTRRPPCPVHIAWAALLRKR